jgi:hypothetical protein
VDVDEAMDSVDVDEEDVETLHEDEAMEGAVDAAMGPISSLHHHHSSCFQVRLPMLLLLLLRPRYHRTPLLALCRKQLAPKNVTGSLDCCIAPLLPTSRNKHSSLTR